MNEREANKYVKKDYIWKKNDYQTLIDNGVPMNVVYFIKTVRNSLPVAPSYLWKDDIPEKRIERLKQYIDTVSEVQSVVAGITTKEEAMTLFDRFMVDSAGYYEKMRPSGGDYYYFNPTVKGRSNSFITEKFEKAIFFKLERDFSYKVTQKAKNPIWSFKRAKSPARVRNRV